MTDLRRLHDLFNELLEVPSERWEAWFDQRDVDTATRAALHRLAEADREAGGPLDRSLGNYARALEAAPEAEAEKLPDPLGRRIGPFRLLKRLGQGGMATVFLAAREGADFEQQVALKLLRRDAFSEFDLALFRRERQVLAKLTHPNISRLIDGGVSEDGVPYLAMELVDGVTITHWCREHALGLRERIALVAKVARAVAAAHAALVVHRDIKPSNVLVDRQGEPRLLDFGIAKLLQPGEDETTRSGTPMTPEYAAPEQFSGGAITTATDVYALGVLMYELLTGLRPQRGSPRAPSVQLAAARGQGALSSTETRRLRGDIDKVALMALAEEPSRRYPGAAAFADDLDRYLKSQPVTAHPPSAWYRTRKFMQRHRGGVMVTALLVLGMLAGFALAIWQAQVARLEAARANAVRDFLIGALDAGAADRPPEQRATIEDLLVAAQRRIAADTTLDAATRVEVLYSLGDVATAAADFDTARLLHAQALREREALAGRLDARALQLRAHLAELHIDAGDIPAARELLDALPPAVFERPQESAVVLSLNRASVNILTGARDAAVADLPRILALSPRAFPDDPQQELRTRLAVAAAYGTSDRCAVAVPIYEAGLAQWRERGMPEDVHYATNLANQAQCLRALGRIEQAIAMARASLDVRRRTHPDGHDNVAISLVALAQMLTAQGELDEATTLLQEALAMRRRQFGPDSTRLLTSFSSLAELARVRRRFDEALQLLGQAERICRLGENMAQPNCHAILHNIAQNHAQLKQLDQAERVANETMALRQRALNPDDPLIGRSWGLLATIAAEAGHGEVALERIDKALAFTESGRIDRQTMLLMRYTRAQVLLRLARHEDALREINDAISGWEQLFSPTHFRLLGMLAVRARAELGLGRRADAQATAGAALALGIDPSLMPPEVTELLRALAEGREPPARP